MKELEERARKRSEEASAMRANERRRELEGLGFQTDSGALREIVLDSKVLPNIRSLALGLLASDKDAHVLEICRELLRQKPVSLLYSAVDCLIGWQPPSHADAMLVASHMNSSNSVDLKVSLATRLANAGSDLGLAALQAGLGDESPQIRGDAVGGLAGLYSRKRLPETVDLFAVVEEKLLHDPSEAVRREMQFTIGGTLRWDRKNLPRLIELLDRYLRIEQDEGNLAKARKLQESLMRAAGESAKSPKEATYQLPGTEGEEP